MTETIDIHRIMQMLPHRYPFLLIDKVQILESNERAIGIKNVTMNEPHFTGHFPEKPIMPGVLIIEAMAQTSAVVVVQAMGADAPKAEDKLVYFMSVDEAKFRKPVVPGDVLHIHVEKQQARRNVWRFSCVAKVDNVPVAEAIVTAMIADK